MDLRVPTLIKFLNRLKSGTAAGNKIYIKGNRRNNFRILKKVVYLVYYLKAILKRGTLNIQLRMNPNSYCLIMAGGIGNRFWPVSNRRCPKQFSDILHCGKSFIRQTYERISQIFPNHRIFIITGEEYEDIIKRQLPEIPDSNILKEPFYQQRSGLFERHPGGVIFYRETKGTAHDRHHSYTCRDRIRIHSGEIERQYTKNITGQDFHRKAQPRTGQYVFRFR